MAAGRWIWGPDYLRNDACGNAAKLADFGRGAGEGRLVRLRRFVYAVDVSTSDAPLNGLTIEGGEAHGIGDLARLFSHPVDAVSRKGPRIVLVPR